MAFLVEAQIDGNAWRSVQDTTVARLTLSRVVPGIPTALRVTASKNGSISAYPPVATVYAASVRQTLRLAA